MPTLLTEIRLNYLPKSSKSRPYPPVPTALHNWMKTSCTYFLFWRYNKIAYQILPPLMQWCFPVGQVIVALTIYTKNDQCNALHSKSLYISRAVTHFHGTWFEIWAGLEVVGNVENCPTEAIISNFWGQPFVSFHGQYYFFLNIVVSKPVSFT